MPTRVEGRRTWPLGRKEGKEERKGRLEGREGGREEGRKEGREGGRERGKEGREGGVAEDLWQWQCPVGNEGISHCIFEVLLT